MVQIKKKAFIYWIATLIWMFIIYLLSSQTASVSYKFSGNIANFIMNVIYDFSDLLCIKISLPGIVQTSNMTGTFYDFNHFIRSLGHILIFFILGTFITNALIYSGVKGIKVFFMSLLFCILYAISDELHQLYVPGRSYQVSDIILDTIGAVFGVSFIMVWHTVIHMISHRLSRKNYIYTHS